MTFVEAAVQILRREGKPLHVKELTRLAIKLNLLSVVGRDPEAMMETRLLIEAKRPSADLVRVSPGVFGLRVYPPRGERGEALKAEGEKVTKPKAESAATPAKDPRAGKRRRTGRGAESVEAGAEAAKKPADPAEAISIPAAEAAPAKAVAEPTSPAKAAPAKGRGRTRTRGTDERKAPPPTDAAAQDAQAAAKESVSVPAATPAPSQRTPAPRVEEAAPVAPPVPVPTVAPPVPVFPVAAASVPAEPVAQAPSPAPAMAVATPAPVVVTPVAAAVTPVAAEPAKTPAPSTKTPTPVAAAPVAPADATSTVAPPVRPAPSTTTPPRPVETAAPQRQESNGPRPPVAANPADKPAAREERPAPSAATPPPGPAQPQQPRVMTTADAAYDVLRGASDGRALTNRQIAEIAVKRRLVRGELADVSRAVRVALVREQRHRDSEGLRPRIRTVGPGQYALGERKLEPELYNAERELLDRASRTREATRVALRRRLRQLPPGAFELLMRLLLERQGMLGPEIVKRGEGVAYYGGTMVRGARSVKVLVAVRPGEGELTKEAVGELRAGVRLRGFEEGLILCSARAGAAAQAEVSAAPGIELYDQDALTELLIRQHLGVRRMHLPVDYLDTELFNELLDQG